MLNEWNDKINEHSQYMDLLLFPEADGISLVRCAAKDPFLPLFAGIVTTTRILCGVNAVYHGDSHQSSAREVSVMCQQVPACAVCRDQNPPAQEIGCLRGWAGLLDGADGRPFAIAYGIDSLGKRFLDIQLNKS